MIGLRLFGSLLLEVALDLSPLEFLKASPRSSSLELFLLLEFALGMSSLDLLEAIPRLPLLELSKTASETALMLGLVFEPKQFEPRSVEITLTRSSSSRSDSESDKTTRLFCKAQVVCSQYRLGERVIRGLQMATHWTRHRDGCGCLVLALQIHCTQLKL